MFFKKNESKVKLNEEREKREMLESKNEELKKEKSKLEEEVEKLKLKKKIEDEDIKHMVKMKEEKQAVELERKTMELEKAQQNAIAKVKDEYQDKLNGRLEKEVENMKEMYGQILQRLPNVTARLKGDV